MLTKSLNPTAIFSRDDVRGAFAILGLDPLYLANEGRFVAIIGHVNEAPCSRGVPLSTIGATCIVDMLSGEQLAQDLLRSNDSRHHRKPYESF